MQQLRFRSRLAAPAPQVWAQVSTMRGVNAELMPLMSMSCPAAYRAQSLERAPAGVPLFASWLRLFGLLPIDRHVLQLERIHAGSGFDERSHSWSQRIWIHRRRVLAVDGGCEVTDELEFEPRLAIAAPLLRGFVRWLFHHRHGVLRRRFGELACPA